MLPAVLLAAVYLVWSPPSADLAAQTFRLELFEANGYEVFSNAWYGGFHLPGYSLLFPPLASLLGIRVVAAISVVVAAGLFSALVKPRYGDRARLAVWLFGAGAATNLFTGRLTFALGVTIGLGALVAASRHKHTSAGALAALSSLASPVAGLFVAFCGGVTFLCGHRARGMVLAVPALLAIAALALLFPTGGVFPFAADTFALIGAATLILVLLLPRSEGELRLAAVLYAALCVVLFVVETPVGGNATRLGAMTAAPLLALGAWGRRPVWLVGLALIPLLYWQWTGPVRDLAGAVGEPSVESAYYDPLLAELADREPQAPFRVHVPPTRNRWEAVFVADRYPLARGWLRQAESDDFDTFTDGNLTAQGYRDWLDTHGVAFVAVSRGAEPDYLSEDEIELIDSGLSYLTPAWSNSDWDLYAVTDPAPLAERPARMTELSHDGFVVESDSSGAFDVQVRWSPWFEVTSGAARLGEAVDGWTEVEALGPGRVVVEANFP